MSRQTYTVTTRVRIEQTFEVDAGCAQDAAEAAELYVARELTGLPDIVIDEPVRQVAKQIGPVRTASTEEKAPAEVPVLAGRGGAR